MNPQIRQSQQSGNALLVVMLMTGIITAALGTYLSLTSNQHQATLRSLCWNAALPIAEAGIEEALSHLDKNRLNFAADGWTQSGTNYYSKAPRTLGDSFYSVNISGSPGSLITITSTGAAHWNDNDYVTRDVQVTVQGMVRRTSPGLVARILALGGNFQADSYDSADPLYSTGGAYDPAKASDKALVATTGSGFTLSGSSHVYGSVAAGPGGSAGAKGAAMVGDANWNTKGIQPGHATNNFTMDMPDVSPPFLSANAPTNGSVGGTNYTYVLDGGKFMTSNLDAAGSSTTMMVQSDSILYVTGNVNLSKIVFAPGVRLDLYLGGSSIAFSPTLVGATAPQFSIFGLPTCTSMILNGGTVFTGLIYAPSCDLKSSGNSSIAGAIIAKSFTCTGTFDFHYDLAAGRGATALPFTILSWNEVY